MSIELLGIHPRELCFTVEPKKQSSCSIQLTNKSDEHVVAFKVKTTSPKKYCVRPNVGIISPNGKCEFTVIMQVQRAAPLDLQCKDKFLIQSTVVPSGTVEEDITPGMFAKDSGKYIEERKLRVILVCLSQSPILAPVNGVASQDLPFDIPQNNKISSGVENLPPLQKEPKGLKVARPIEDSRLKDDAETILNDSEKVLPIAESIEYRSVKGEEEIKLPKNEIEDELKKESEELKSKLDVLGLKLVEAEQTVVKLNEERMKAVQENDLVKRELALMKRKIGGKTVHMGFPLLYICMVALISLAVGYLMQ
ncbi:vesicle-associated protein 2-2-like [Amaranthus tricolor]|uniref:vesicle-associated protein 2-2-like n=1 Tax=Amaranthus tricolor TaxID=29722 RepID=UPI00258CF348|nr:vesicle-associated protein 2-2-like [Amaranthus tricolor]